MTDKGLSSPFSSADPCFLEQWILSSFVQQGFSYRHCPGQLFWLLSAVLAALPQSGFPPRQPLVPFPSSLWPLILSCLPPLGGAAAPGRAGGRSSSPLRSHSRGSSQRALPNGHRLALLPHADSKPSIYRIITGSLFATPERLLLTAYLLG